MSMREAYEQKLDAQLREWQARIDALKARAERASAEQKVEYYEQIETLRTKQDDLQDKLTELRQAGEGAWQDIKVGADLAWKDVQDAFSRAAEKFK